ncbi:c-type cytochrome biogenesis protein CcmI [Salipiger sp. IMCC34102]|uniref:c-type cytochrome biogenesis protein CcmI n=1 Tax=Salipiger sp. IMCC34102 TaxID=2510647 RepID=UPI00101CC3E7|nr:c-type cytochrome biogenesis protein CcmI [Salipiger sp. IMCC34102]RYH03337.1 c-type cytochrome biogenesis protein CcmI [Salipiger sp. IMCC34102]
MFWILCTLLTLVVVSYLALPLLRPEAGEEAAPDVEIYKAQLAEVDRDVARGTLDADDAERARVEISRRLLAAARADRATGVAAPRVNRLATGLVLLLVAGVGAATYAFTGAPGVPDQPLEARLAQAEDMRRQRPGQEALEAETPPLPAAEADPEYLAQIEQLRQVVPTRPDDLEGWTLLAYHESQLNNFAAAARAQTRVVELKRDEVELVDLVRQADLMVIAADGIISPEAEAVARQILAQDPDNVPATYFLGAMYYQTGRPDVAFRAWRSLAESGAQSFHAQMARSQIERAAAQAGIDYTLPALPGPSAEEIAAAEDMAPEDRAAFIEGMVAQLSDRLATQGGPASEWARLISAYGVLGDTSAAATVWGEAQQVFADDPSAMEALRAAAGSAGVLE